MVGIEPFIKSLEGRPVFVLGLGLSGMSVLRAVLRAGAQAVAWDDNPEKRAEADRLGVPLRDPVQMDFGICGALVAAPGIPLRGFLAHPAISRAKESGLQILGDLEILHRTGHGRKTIGITGTNGKSTTTALTGHILNACGLRTAVGGNIGKPVLDLVMPPKDGAFVLEISSFQADLCPTFRPDIAALLNITPDHIDRHGNMDNYVAAKARLFEGPGTAVIGVDDELTARIFADVRAREERRTFPVSVRGRLAEGVFVEDGVLYDGLDGKPCAAGSLSVTTLQGLHNHQNAATAYAICRLAGLESAPVMEAMKTYPGLAHRQQIVRVINGVAYINDSKATNADATARALSCFRNIYWIAGGRPKDGGLSGLETFMDRIRHAFLIGEAAEDFGTWLENHGVSHNFSGTLDRALNEAHKAAQDTRGQPGGAGVVLLSPACASYDQFKSFEHRGEDFIARVQNLGTDS